MRERRRDLLDVVGHEHNGRGRRVDGQCIEVRNELLAAGEVERCRRLVEQDHCRVGEQRAGQEHALAFAGRQRRENVIGERAAPDALEHFDSSNAVGLVVDMPPGLERRELRRHDHVAYAECRS